MGGILIQLLFLIFLVSSIKKAENAANLLTRENTNALKFTCSIIIIFSHIMYAGSNLFLGYPHFICVTIFFLISGYGLTESFLNGRDKFLKKTPIRLIKLSAPFIFVALLKLVFSFPLEKGGFFWFNVIILFYLFFTITAFFFRNKYFLFAANCLFSICYAFFFQEIVTTKHIGFAWTQFFGWAQQSTGFCIGIMISIWKDRIFSLIKKHQIILSIISIILFILAGVQYIKPHDINIVTNFQFLLREILSLTAIILIFIFYLHFKFENRIINYIGSKMAIYTFAFHGFFISVCERFFNCQQQVNLIIFTIIAATLITSFLCSIATDKIKRFFP